MSKFSVHGLAEALRYELRPYGVGVVLIVPGFIDTEIRKVDNWGIYHPGARDKVPPRLRMPAEKAARQIANAIYKRQNTKVITGLGKFSVFLQRHFPKLLSLLVSRIELQGKSSLKKHAG